MSLAQDVAAFGTGCALAAAQLAIVEALLGLPAAPPAALPAFPADAPGMMAGAADLAAARTLLDGLADALRGLRRRIDNLADALLTFVRAQRSLDVRVAAAPAGLPGDDRLSRAALDGLQKRLVAGEDVLAGLELRVAAAEDALDAFFGTTVP